MSKLKTPFCPKCGQKENIEKLDEYFSAWICKSCKIRFDFSKLSNKSKKSMFDDLVDPGKGIKTYWNILDPARKITFEVINQDVKIVADIKSTEELFNTLKLRQDFKSPFDIESGSKKTHFNPKGREFKDLKI